MIAPFYINLVILLIFVIVYKLSRITLKWELGRQGSGYYRMKLYSFWRIDCYFLKFPKGSYIAPHTDPTDGIHWRLNIILWSAKSGGRFQLNNKYIYRRIILFRPDKKKHMVTRIMSGTRYVLSFGVKF